MATIDCICAFRGATVQVTRGRAPSFSILPSCSSSPLRPVVRVPTHSLRLAKEAFLIDAITFMFKVFVSFQGAREGQDQLPRLIAFAPSVELLFKSRADVHRVFLYSLVAAAILSDRVPVYPLIPCDSPWLAHRNTIHVKQDTLEATNVVDRFVVPFGPLNDLRCFWKAWACKECHRVGVPWYDFERELMLQPRTARKPTEGMPQPPPHELESATHLVFALTRRSDPS